MALVDWPSLRVGSKSVLGVVATSLQASPRQGVVKWDLVPFVSIGDVHGQGFSSCLLPSRMIPVELVTVDGASSSAALVGRVAQSAQ